MDVSTPVNLVLTSGLLHTDDVEPIWSGALIFLKLPIVESSSCPFEELELDEMLPKEELLWFLFVKLDDELPIGIGTGTYGVAILHEKNLSFRSRSLRFIHCISHAFSSFQEQYLQ